MAKPQWQQWTSEENGSPDSVAATVDHDDKVVGS